MESNNVLVSRTVMNAWVLRPTIPLLLSLGIKMFICLNDCSVSQVFEGGSSYLWEKEKKLKNQSLFPKLSKAC